MVNLVTKDYHPIAVVAKNVAAGAVLVAAVVAVFVGYLVFIDELAALDGAILRSDLPPRYLVPVALAAITLPSSRLRPQGDTRSISGGMPSGHTGHCLRAGHSYLVYHPGSNHHPGIPHCDPSGPKPH